MNEIDIESWRKHPSLGEVYGYQAIIEREALATANVRYAYSLERRDKLSDRVRFGSLALNGATLAALAGVLGDAKSSLIALGVTDTAIRTAFVLLVIGMIQSALAIWWSGICFTNWASLDSTRLFKARHRAALMEMKRSEESQKQLSDMMSETQEVSGFEMSKLDILLTNGGGSFWIGSMLALLWPVLRSML